MPLFRKQYLLLSSLFCLCIFSCRISKYNSIKKCQSVIFSEQQIKPILDKNNAIKFKTSIDILNNHLSGFVIVKQTEIETTHLIFVTELGMKMFDFEMKDSIMKAIYVFEPLNKTALVKALTTNFKDIFFIGRNGLFVTSCINKKSLPVYFYSHQKEKYFYTTNNTGTLSMQEKFYKRKKQNKIIYQFNNQINNYSEIKSVQYGIIKIKIELQKITD